MPETKRSSDDKDENAPSPSKKRQRRAITSSCRVERASGTTACHMIRAAATDSDASNPLLVITTDASVGNRCSGLTAILRRIGGDASAGAEDPAPALQDAGNDNHDEIYIVTDHVDWDDSTPAEAAALALGMREATIQFPTINRILILSDCEGALDLYLNTQSKMRKELLDADFWIQAYGKLRQQASTIHFCSVTSAKSKQSGFFDHEAADLISAAARIEDNIFISKHIMGVPALRDSDLKWLQSTSGKKKKKKGGRGPRKARCRERMRNEFMIAGV